MKKLPDWLSHRGFWMAVATAGLLILAAGIVVGSWIAQTKETGATIGGVVSSFLGAAVAVAGAVWVQSAKEAREEAKGIAIVSRIVQRLNLAAHHMTDFKLIAGMDDKPRLQVVQSALRMREHLMLFRPYQALGDGDLPLVMMDVDMISGALVPLAGPTVSTKFQHPVPGFQVVEKFETPRTDPDLMAVGIQMLRVTNKALRHLGLEVPKMSEKQRFEMKRMYGDEA